MKILIAVVAMMAFTACAAETDSISSQESAVVEAPPIDLLDAGITADMQSSIALSACFRACRSNSVWCHAQNHCWIPRPCCARATRRRVATTGVPASTATSATDAMAGNRHEARHARVERQGGEHAGEEMLTGDFRWWWLSFADERRPEGQQFLGACMVQAWGMGTAVAEAHRRKLNPGGEVIGLAIPDGAPEPLPEWTNRLLTRASARPTTGW